MPEGEKLYRIGIELLKAGNYWEADSVFSVALGSIKNENVYYNRGLARLFLMDTIGFCQDLDVASYRYHDNEAARLFNQYCCKKVDTIFYDKNFNASSNLKFRFYEEILKLKYDSVTLGTIHDTKNKKPTLIIDDRCDSELPSVQSRFTDVIASYTLIDSIKCFYQATSPIEMNNQNGYDDFIYEIEDNFRQQYGDIKKKYNLMEIELFYEFTVTDKGNVINSKYLGSFPEIISEEDNIELSRELLKLLKNHPKFIPAKFRQKKVYYISKSSILF